jgi:hypothetical protein
VKIATGALFLAALPAMVAAVTPYPRVPGDVASADYPAVTVNGIPVETVGTTMGVGYAHFAFDSGPVRVEITAREPIQSFDLSPHRQGIQAVVAGRVLAFELPEPRKLHLRINGLQRFFILGDPPETDAPQPGQPGVYSVADFGVTSHPTQNQTAALQHAIDEVAAKQGVLHVPAGIYRSGRLLLRSNLSLHLAAGAILKGTGRLEDYPRSERGPQQLHFGGGEHVRIFGRGIIDGHGLTLRRDAGNSNASRARLVTTFQSHDFSMDGVILREAGVWCVHPVESTDLRFTNLKVISQTRAEWPTMAEQWEGSNTDGFDPDNSSRVRIENCFISVDDDAIAVKLRNGTRRDMADIEFRRNVVWTMCSALKIGTEITEHTVRNVVFADNDIVNADVGIAVWCWRGGGVDGAQWINNYFEGIGVVPKESPHKKETNIRLTIRNVNNEGLGHIRHLLIKDNTFERFSPNDALLQGGDDAHLIEGVTFDNLVIAGKKRTSDEDARLTVGRFTRDVVFK